MGMGETYEERFWSKVDVREQDECWEWQGYTPLNSYGRASLTVGKTRLQQAHRVAYYFANKRLPSQYVLHSCDNKPCCNPNHLREGTAKENSQDAIDRQVLAYGERHHNAKLNDAKVREIRRLLDQGVAGTKVAKMFGVSICPIYGIKNNTAWRHVTS
jgi:hypothetical protein